MAQITLGGKPIHTVASLPSVDEVAPDFTLTKIDLTEVKLADFHHKKIILSIFPSVDTGTCATAMRKFNIEASKHPDVMILCVSMDLPFALKRFCAAENVDNVLPLSAFRHPEFGSSQGYGVTIADGPLAGLLSRAVVIIGADGKVLYTEQVTEIADEPDYEAALKVLR